MSSSIRDPVVYFGFISFAVASFVINGFVFHTVINKYLDRSNRRRPVLLLIAHLAILAFLVPFLNCFVSSDVFHIIHFPQSKCRLISYSKTVVHCAYAVNIVVIVYELIGSFRRDKLASNGIQILKTLMLLWTIPIIFSLPTWWMIQPKNEYIRNLRAVGVSGNFTLDEKIGRVREKCVSVTLLSSDNATILYEFVRLLLFYVVVAICMVVAIYKVRRKLNFLNQIADPGHQERVQRQAHSVRLIYFYFLSVIFLWFPSGVIIFYRRVLPRIMPNDRSAEKRNTSFKIIASFAVLGYLSLCPLISLLFIETQNNLWSICSRIAACFDGRKSTTRHSRSSRSRSRSSGETRGKEARRKSSGKEQPEFVPTQVTFHGNTSRFSTIGFTTTAAHITPTPAPLHSEATHSSGAAGRESLRSDDDPPSNNR